LILWSAARDQARNWVPGNRQQKKAGGSDRRIRTNFDGDRYALIAFHGAGCACAHGGHPHFAAASQQYVTCDDFAKAEKAGQPLNDGQANWNAMANVICSSIERMREISSANETKAAQDEIHRLYLAAVDGEALKIRAVPSCIRHSDGDGDLEARVVKIVRGFISENRDKLRQSTKPVQIMATARWPEKLEGLVDTGQGDPVPISWLFRCRSDKECKLIDIQLAGSISMTESIRSELATSAHCAK
jgi:hypothetical protein